MNFAVYVSNKATRLNKVIEEGSSLLEDIKVVFSDNKENLYLEKKLYERGISYIASDYHELKSKKDQNKELSDQLLDVLNSYKVDYCFSFGAHILKGELLEVYKNRIINFHPSILPAFPGNKAIDQALAGDISLLGNTAHFIDAGIDTGLIILQSVHHINAFYDGGYDAILDAQIEMLYKISSLLKENKITIVNNKVKITNADYTSYTIFPRVL